MLLLIYVESYNPVYWVQENLARQFQISVHKGDFYLLEKQFAQRPEQSWQEHAQKLEKEFGYEFKLLSVADAKKQSLNPQDLTSGKFDYFYNEPQKLTKRLGDSDWAIAITLDQTQEEDNFRSASGTAYLLRDIFSQQSPERWPELVESLQPNFGLTLKLLDINTVKLPDDALAYLKNKGISWHSDESDAENYYLKLNASTILQVGPIEISRINAVMIISLLVILCFAMSLGLLSWLRPLWRDLKTLDEKARQFGEGHLGSRAQIKRSSIASRLGQSFNLMADNIQQLITSNQHLTNAVAHDLRTPLARLRFAIEILESEDCSEQEQHRYKQSIQDSMDALDYLINQTLLHSRYSRVADISKFSACDLAALIRHEVEQYSWEIEPISWQLNIDEQFENCTSLVDGKALQRALVNMLSNASRYAVKSVSVSLTLQENDQNEDQLVLAVEDDGPGISEDQYSTVFQPFVQLENVERGGTAGQGLGLSIVEQIAKWHRGTAHVSRSASLGGARFEVRWPAHLESSLKCDNDT